MIKRMLLLGTCLLSHALITQSEVSRYQLSLRGNRAYVTANGDQLNILIPMKELYDGQTTYLAKGADNVVKIFTELIAKSSGRIALQGLLNENVSNMNFNKSAVYAQVTHLSEYLLTTSQDVSYSPVVVNAYQKNHNYGIWKIYPEDEIFLNLSLIID